LSHVFAAVEQRCLLGQAKAFSASANTPKK